MWQSASLPTQISSPTPLMKNRELPGSVSLNLAASQFSQNFTQAPGKSTETLLKQLDLTRLRLIARIVRISISHPHLTPEVSWLESLRTTNVLPVCTDRKVVPKSVSVCHGGICSSSKGPSPRSPRSRQREQASYPWLLHFLNGKLEQVGQLFNGEHGHSFALRLDAFRYCNLLQVKK